MTLMKHTEHDHKQMERYTMFLDWKDRYYQSDHTTQGDLQTQ